MANPEIDIDFSDPTKHQLDKLAAQELDTAAVTGINDLRLTIGEKIARARNEGVISGNDKEDLEHELQKADTDRAAISVVDQRVTKVIEESKQLISGFSDKEELALFKELSLAEKRSYVETLRNEASKLQQRADRLAGLLPEAKEKLRGLKTPERAKYIEELNVRRENVAKYVTMLERYRRHFGGTSCDQFVKEFKELSLEKQVVWLKVDEEKEARPRAALTGRFEALPAKYRDTAKNFFDLSRHEKEALVTKLEEEKTFDDKVDGSENSRHLSRESKEYARDMFRRATASLRGAMMDMLEKQMKAEAELSRRFEKLPPGIRARHSDFYDLRYERKEEILASVDEAGEKLTEQYKALLLREMADKVISADTYQSYLSWFEKQDISVRREAMKPELFDAREMGPRRRLKERFERELPPKVRQANEHFYELSGHERMELFERLKKAQETAVPKDNAHLEEMPGNFHEFHEGGDEKAAGNKAETEVVDAVELEEQLKKEKGTDSMKRKIRRKNIADGLAELKNKSDLYNRGVSDSIKKDQHLGSGKERELNRRLVEHSRGRVVAGRGSEKSRKVKEVDLTMLDQMTEDEILALKNEVTANRGDKAQNVYHLDLQDRKTGRKLTGAMGKNLAEEQENVLQTEIAEKAEKNMEAGGAKLSGRKREKLRQIAEKDDLEIDLQAA